MTLFIYIYIYICITTQVENVIYITSQNDRGYIYKKKHHLNDNTFYILYRGGLMHLGALGEN